MPKIREIRHTTFASEAGLPPTRRASGADFDTSDPSAGRGLMAAAQGIGQMMDKMRAEEERAELSDIHAGLAMKRAQWTVSLQERMQAAAPGDTSFAEKFMADLSADLDKGAEGLKTKAGAAAYRAQSAAIAAHFVQSAGVFQAQSVATKARTDYETFVNSSALAVFNDPSSYNSAVYTAQQAINDPASTYARVGGGREKLLAGATERMAVAALQGLTKQDPGQALSYLVTGTGPAADIPIEQRNGLENDARAAIERGARETGKQVEAERQMLLSDLKIGVDRGTKGYADVEGAYAQGVVSPAERTELIKKLDDKAREEIKVTEGINRVSAAFAGGPQLDFRSKDDKTALDNHFALTAQGWKDLPPGEVVDRTVEYVAQVGIAPTRVQGMIRGFLRSGNPDQALLAADAVKRLRNANPQILNDFNDEDLRLANVVGALTDSGVPPQAALQMAKDQMAVSKQEQDARSDDFDAVRGADRTARIASDRSWLEGKKNSFWASDPNVDPVMQREFETLARQEYARTGNLEAARTFALDQVDRVWGRSSVAGADRYMKFAPEKFYGVPSKSQADNAAWMREQLVADISRDALQDPNNPITGDKLLIVPAGTKTGPDGRPLYIVSFMGTDGLLRAVVSPKGKPIYWRPDWSTSAQAGREKAAQQEQVEAARRARETKYAPGGQPMPVVP